MDQTEAVSAFADLLARDDDDIEIDRAALLFAATEYPDLDIEASLTTLDEFAEQLGPRMVGHNQPLQVARTVAEFLHGQRFANALVGARDVGLQLFRSHAHCSTHSPPHKGVSRMRARLCATSHIACARTHSSHAM